MACACTASQVNVINWSMLTEESLLEESGTARVKCWVFVSFVFAFSGIIGAVWVLVQEINTPSWEAGSVDPALRGLLQNLFIFAGSLLFRLVRTSDDS